MFAGEIDEKLVSPGLLGFLVVAAIGFALYFLVKSMNRQISKIDFDEGDGERRPPAEAPRDEAANGGT